MLRPKRRAAPTVFVDNGTIPEDTSAEERSISDEENLLIESEDDVCGSVNSSSEEEAKPVTKNTKPTSTVKPVEKKVIAKPTVGEKKVVAKPAEKKIVARIASEKKVVSKDTVGEKKVAIKSTATKKVASKPVSTTTSESTKDSPKKSMRAFRLDIESISPQGSSPRVNTKKIKAATYNSATPIQAARKIAPVIYAAKVSVSSVSSYTFNIQEIIGGDAVSDKKFCYTCESTSEGGAATHIIKPKTKKVAKKVTEQVGAVKKAPKNQHPSVEKKEVPVRTNVKKLVTKEVKKAPVKKVASAK